VSVGFSSTSIAETDPTKPPMVNNKVLKPVAKISEKVKQPKVKVKKRKGWRLRSTLVSDDRRTAVINNKVLMIGEKLNGATLVDIQPGKVQIRVKGKIRTLRLVKKDVKTNVRQIVNGVNGVNEKKSHEPTRKNGL